jgi:hypothetical protein
MKTKLETLEELFAIERRCRDTTGTIDLELGEAISDVYFDIELGGFFGSVEDAVEKKCCSKLSATS